MTEMHLAFTYSATFKWEIVSAGKKKLKYNIQICSQCYLQCTLIDHESWHDTDTDNQTPHFKTLVSEGVFQKAIV